ncbi:MAG: polymer-forming cytoskeletal protein [Caldilineaceae bacterium]
MNTRRKFASSRWRRVSMALMAAILCAFGVFHSAQATEFRGGANIVIPANQVIDDDLFVSGETVEVNGVVKGNLFAAGTEVTVNGHVEGSLFIAGQTLKANGPVDGSIYVGGYDFTLGPEARVGRNLSFGGFNLLTQPGSMVGRSLYGGGYQFLLNGDVTNDVNIGGGALELNGAVGGDVLGGVGNPEEATPTFMPAFPGAVTMVAPGLRVGDSARIGGALNVEIAETSAQVAAAKTAAPLYSIQNATTRWAIGELIALLLVGALLLYLWPRLVNQTGQEAVDHWLPDIGVGFLSLLIVFVGAPILLGLVILLAIWGGWLTFGQLAGEILAIGLTTIGFAIAAFIFVAGMLTKIIIAHQGGRMILFGLMPNLQARWRSEFSALVIGALIYIVLRVLPFGIGWVVGFVVTVLGLGAIYFVLRGRPETPVAAPVSTPVLREAPA